MLVSAAADEFSHLEGHFDALTRAFARRSIELVRCEAGTPDSTELARLARDPALLFFLSFNGWGANLAWQDAAGTRQSFFAHAGKPLLDHFADPPFANEMQHAQLFDTPEHVLLFTDYSYLGWDSLRGAARHSSYFLPQFVPDDGAPAKPHKDRSMNVLLPVSLYDPDHYYRLMLSAAPDRREGQALFDELVGTFLHDLRSDAMNWVAQLWLNKDRPFNARRQQPVVSAAWHYIKNRRRQLLLESLSDLPLTIVTRDIPYPLRLHPHTRVLAPRSFSELGLLVRDARLCLCPTPHVRGFHERVLLALTQGAVALSSPNQVCEEQFLDGEEMLYFQDLGDDLRRQVGKCGDDPHWAEAIALQGTAAVRRCFTADVTVDRMLRIFHNHRARTSGTAG